MDDYKCDIKFTREILLEPLGDCFFTFEEIMNFNQKEKFYYLTEPVFLGFILNNVEKFIIVWNSFTFSQKLSFLDIIKNEKMSNKVFVQLAWCIPHLNDIKGANILIYMLPNYYTNIENVENDFILNYILYFNWKCINDFQKYSTMLQKCFDLYDINMFIRYHMSMENNSMVILLYYVNISKCVPNDIMENINILDKLIVSFKYDINTDLYHLLKIIFTEKRLEVYAKYVVENTMLIPKNIWKLNIDISAYNIHKLCFCVHIFDVSMQYVSYENNIYYHTLIRVLNNLKNKFIMLEETNEEEEEEAKEEEEEEEAKGECELCLKTIKIMLKKLK